MHTQTRPARPWARRRKGLGAPVWQPAGPLGWGCGCQCIGGNTLEPGVCLLSLRQNPTSRFLTPSPLTSACHLGCHRPPARGTHHAHEDTKAQSSGGGPAALLLRERSEAISSDRRTPGDQGPGGMLGTMPPGGGLASPPVMPCLSDPMGTSSPSLAPPLSPGH